MKLCDFDQWVLWKQKKNEDGRKTKIPIGINGRAISITNTKCYRTFNNALQTYLKNTDIFDGVGFCFTEDDPFVGVDLDSINKWNGSKEIVKRLNSYTEKSPSGNGLHVICEGYVPGGKHGLKVGDHERGEIAIYDAKRYFTVTLDYIEGHDEVQKSQEAIEWLTKTINDQELISGILQKDQKNKFIRLFEGKFTEAGYTSQSEADLAFCRILSNNHAPMHQIDRIYRKSRLMRPKWDEKRGSETYGLCTIGKVISGDK